MMPACDPHKNILFVLLDALGYDYTGGTVLTDG